MAFPPEAFIIGAQRSATTSLAYLLNQHPMIVVAEPKEPNFLTLNWDRGMSWYRSCFRREDAILVDASVSYSMFPFTEKASRVVAPKRAFELSPNAKFVYMVRDPADRCYSAYWHDVRAGREKRSLREAVEAGAYYSCASYYYRQLEAFLEYFPLERFLIVKFDEFTRCSDEVTRNCAEFFGAARNFDFVLQEPKNQAFVYNRFGKAIRDAFGERALKLIGGVAKRSLPFGFRPFVKQMLHDQVPPMSKADRRWLMERFQEDAAAFENLTGIDVVRQEE